MKKQVSLQNKCYVEIDENLLHETGEIKIIGEPIHAPEQNTTVPRGAFEIAYLASICDILDQLGNKKIKVLQYILKHKDSSNCLNMTNSQLADAVGCSRPVVIDTIKMLTDAGVLTRKNTVIMLSPRFIVKGDAQREGYLMRKFTEAKSEAEETRQSNVVELPPRNSNRVKEG